MTHGMWQYADRLPPVDPRSIVSLGEGGTPVVDLTEAVGRELGVASLVAKAEDRNPTGSFKARIASVNGGVSCLYEPRTLPRTLVPARPALRTDRFAAACGNELTTRPRTAVRF